MNDPQHSANQTINQGGAPAWGDLSKHRKLVWIGFGLAVVSGIAWLSWLCFYAAEVGFLAHSVPADWIVYPKPPSGQVQGRTDASIAPELSAVFRRSFSLQQVPSSATLEVRAFRRSLILINGTEVQFPASKRNWKSAQKVDIKGHLRPGENVILTQVYNRGAPPALWISMGGEGWSLRSDRTWLVSYEGAAWRPAALASETLDFETGNPLRSPEKILTSLRSHWQFLLICFLSAVMLICVAQQLFLNPGGRWRLPRWLWDQDPAKVAFGLTILLFVVLVTHNSRLLAPSTGFDHGGHVEYIGYIQQHGVPPPATHGWETFQPPLYYIIAATLLNALKLTAGSFDGIIALRFLSLAFGLAHISLVFATLRLLFPREPGKQITGLLLAGFMPMQIYITHYVNNEVLASCLMCATLFITLRIAVLERGTAVSYIVLGTCFGLAMVTKVTALVLTPFVAIAVLFKWIKGPKRARRWAFPMLTVLTFLLCTFWYYWPLWGESGYFSQKPRWPYGVSYFQDPGYRSVAWFTRIGTWLDTPSYSGIKSLADGVYSTAWGDGLWGGAIALEQRPPWTYDLMGTGYLLALVPTILILLGFVLIVWRALLKPHLAWLLLIGFGSALMLGLIHMNLTLPTYAVTKGFYCLSGLVAASALGAVGWEFASRRFRWIQYGSLALLLVWAAVSYASFWIHPDSPATQTSLARDFISNGEHSEALAHVERALKVDPGNSEAGACLFQVMVQRGQISNATALANLMIERHPDEAKWRLNLALVLDAQGQSHPALDNTREAALLSPGDPGARLALAARLNKLGMSADAVEASREALSIIPTDEGPHLALATALLARARQKDPKLTQSEEGPFTLSAINSTGKQAFTGEAVDRLRYVLFCWPDSLEALEPLAWILATSPDPKVRNGGEAVRLAERGCKQTSFKNLPMVLALAAAYAEDGRQDAAKETLNQARALLVNSEETVLRKVYGVLSESIDRGLPYRDKSL